MIDVSPRDFLHTHKGLVKLLRLIAEAGAGGIPTRKLCDEAFKTRDSFCIELLESAQEQGYITRKEQSRSPKIGRSFIVNKLTPSGKKLLQQLEGIDED